MYGYIYEVYSELLGIYYIGQKKSNHFKSTYYGSSKYILKLIKKYGKDSFSVRLIELADSQNQLDQLEIKYIKYYKDIYGEKCINKSKGGLNGGNFFEYYSDDEITNFKENARKRMKDKYSDIKERKKQSDKIRKSWDNLELRKRQSETVKSIWNKRKADNISFNKKECIFILDDLYIEFESVKKLKKFIKDTYHVEFGNSVLHDMLKSESPYSPFHKNNKKLQKLSGMILKFNILKDEITFNSKS